MSTTEVLLALVPFLLLLVGFVAYCLVDVARAPITARAPKWVWVLLCLYFIPLGGVLYLLLGRPQPAAEPKQ